jgi:L-asparaginase II
VDGCGLPTFALPLDRVARACAKFAAAQPGSPAATIATAMSKHPEFVAGTGRMCTALMAVSGGRLFAKVGAEGYYCAGVPHRQLGIALKIEDGARRASEPALLAVLRALEVLSDRELEALHEFAHPAVLNTRGETVGEVRARVHLTSHSV